MKTYLTSILTLIIIVSCSKEHQVKRDLNGTYDISELRVDYLANGYDCQQGDIDYTFYKVDNPGKIRFTGKKPIQGSYVSLSNKTYIGYFDFKYSVTDLNGNVREQDDKIMFQYEMVQHSTGDFDTIQIHIIDEYNYEADLILEREGDEIVAFKYPILRGSCYTGYRYYKVK
ncbi:MAG: hypothetical protein R3279_02755 [Putridiphycobacter sp.]|nr:hypothetical protein [Putridiphycobacter sp.]